MLSLVFLAQSLLRPKHYIDCDSITLFSGSITLFSLPCDFKVTIDRQQLYLYCDFHCSIHSFELLLVVCSFLVTSGKRGLPRCMTARDRFRAWDVNFFGSSNLTHKSCGIFCSVMGFRPLYWYQAGIPQFFLSHRKVDKWSNVKTHKVLKMCLLIFILAAFIRESLEPQRLLIQIWRSSVTDACKQSDKS